MKKLKIRMAWLSTICVLSLNACSQNNADSRPAGASLQSEFNQYFKGKQYSKYVQANLKDGSHRSESQQAKSLARTNANSQNKVLSKLKYQLSSKKRSASNQLKSAIANNGLFKLDRVYNNSSNENTLKQQAPLARILTTVLHNNLATFGWVAKDNGEG
jgi:hypothetical protein